MATLHARARQLMPSSVGAVLRGAAPVVVAVAAAALLQLVVRPFLPDFFSKLLLDIATNVVLAVSLTMVNGFTGQFSIGHAAFMAVGGYTAASIVYYGSYRFFGDPYVHGGLVSTLIDGRDVPLVAGGDALFLVALLAGGLAAALCGYLVGLPSLRLKGDYLAIVTLGFGEIVRVVIQSQTTESLADGASVTQGHLNVIEAWRGRLNVDDYMTAQDIAQLPVWAWPRYVGGSIGFSGLPFYTSHFWAWTAALLTLLVAVRLKYSSFGRAFLSIREDEIAAEAMGVHTTRYKVRAFVLAAFFAGIAGGLYAHTVGVQLNAGELAFMKSFDIIIMVVLGGLGSISGAAVAAGILTLLPETLRSPPSLLSWWAVLPLAIGALLLVFAQRKARALVILLIACAAWEGLRAYALANGVDLSKYRMVLYAVALILMMILRPRGLLGVRELWELRLPRSPARPGARPPTHPPAPTPGGAPGGAGS